MFGRDRKKNQGEEVRAPNEIPPDVVVSPDTRRTDRVPPGQSRTKKWPVLDASGAPEIDMAAWRFRIGGLAMQKVKWTWQEFLALPRSRLFSDFHCVTPWA